MSVAVPIILVLALATSLYGQNESSWLNFQNWQSEQNDKADELSKNQPEKTDDNPSEMKRTSDRDSKSASNGKSDRASSSAPKIWRGPDPKRLE